MADTVSTTRFRRIIFDLLPTGHSSIATASRRCGIPVRTLQRQLHDAGVTYSQLFDEVRFEAACRMLPNPTRHIADIETVLGYTDQSNFSRAFQRWTGISPSQYQCWHSKKRKQ
jgi:AraC-like DNA-binding protein